jgi:hypothetical protein
VTKAVAKNIIKTDDKVTVVTENDNVSSGQPIRRRSTYRNMRPRCCMSRAMRTNDIRKSKVDADRIRNRDANAAGQRPRNAGQGAAVNRPKASNIRPDSVQRPKNVTRLAREQRPGSNIQNRPARQNSVIGNPGNRHQVQRASNRGQHSMGGGHRGGGGHMAVRHGGGGRRR